MDLRIAPTLGVYVSRAVLLIGWLAVLPLLAGCGASGSGGSDDDDDGGDDDGSCELGACATDSDLQIKGFTVTATNDDCAELALTFSATNRSSERQIIDCGEGSLVSGPFTRVLDPNGCDPYEAVCPSYEDDGDLCSLFPEQSIVNHFEARSCSDNELPMAPGTVFTMTLRVFLDDGTPLTATAEAAL